MESHCPSRQVLPTTWSLWLDSESTGLFSLTQSQSPSPEVGLKEEKPTQLPSPRLRALVAYYMEQLARFL